MSALDAKLVFSDIRSHCLLKPGCIEEYPWEHYAWKLKGKIFAIGTEDQAGFTIKSTLDQQAVLIMHPQIAVASHVGRYGWIHITVVDSDTLGLAKDLIDASYELLLRRPAKKK